MPRGDAFVADRGEGRIAAELRVTFVGGEGRTRNVSTRGIYFVTESVLAVGQPIELQIQFPDLPAGGLQVTCNGHVLRVENEGALRGVAAAIASFAFRRMSSRRGKQLSGETKG